MAETARDATLAVRHTGAALPWHHVLLGNHADGLQRTFKSTRKKKRDEN
jgi:hypothetical protein